MNVPDEVTPESFVKLWRKIRHCEESPNCKVVRGYNGNNFYLDLQPTRTVVRGEKLTINFRIVSPADLDGFPELITIVADKLAAHDKAKMANPGPSIEADKHLDHSNENVSHDNASSEANLTRMKSTIDAMLSKIAAQTGKTLENDGQLHKVAVHDQAKTAALGPLIEANERLYHANKKLSAENAASEAKLTHTKRTINALVSKIAAQTGRTVGKAGELTQRLRDAVGTLLAHSSMEDAEKLAAAPDGSNNFEVTLLTEQLKKLELSNERLSTDLQDLKKQHGALRNQKKEAAGQKKL